MFRQYILNFTPPNSSENYNEVMGGVHLLGTKVSPWPLKMKVKPQTAVQPHITKVSMACNGSLIGYIYTLLKLYISTHKVQELEVSLFGR